MKQKKIPKYISLFRGGSRIPVGGAPKGGGAPTYNFAKFSEKLHENEILGHSEGGAHAGGAHLDPPLLFL